MKLVEQMGDEGDVDESMRLLQHVEVLKRQKIEADKLSRKGEDAPEGYVNYFITFTLMSRCAASTHSKSCVFAKCVARFSRCTTTKSV